MKSSNVTSVLESGQDNAYLLACNGPELYSVKQSPMSFWCGAKIRDWIAMIQIFFKIFPRGSLILKSRKVSENS